MGRKRILISRKMPEAVIAVAKSEYEIHELNSPHPLTVEEAKNCLRDYDGAIPSLGDKFTAEAFASSKHLKCRILANFGVGYNHIDVASAEWHGITVTNTPSAVTDSTADIAVTLILNVARRIIEGERLVRSGNWEGWQPTQLLGSHVTGKTLGIIGMGRIGEAIAKRCNAGFDMSVLYYNRSKKSHLPFPATPMKTPSQVMAIADFVVVTVAYNDDSYHLVNKKLLNSMKPNAFLINVSRGEVIDESALVEALEQKQIAGAGLDVYEFEPQIPERLKKLDNVVLLPHMGTSVLEVREAMGMMALYNLKAFFAGDVPPNRVVNFNQRMLAVNLQ